MEHPEYLLIAIPEKRTNWGNVCKNGEIAYKNAKNVDNFQQSKVKESKVKESKVKLLRVVVRVKAKKHYPLLLA